MSGRHEARPGIALWNVADGVTAMTGAQERFLILGNIADPAGVEQVTYSLNAGPETPVVFRASRQSPTPTRLSGVGDFSIDTITTGDLLPTNDLRLTVGGRNGSRLERLVRFPTAPISHPETGLHLDLRGGQHPQQFGQMVDGRWQRSTDEEGRACLRISPNDAGLDRVALFTRPILSPNYTVSARLRVDQWMRGLHNVGIVFGWRGHRPGNGEVLPPDWTTGLGYYYSHCKGLRLRVGENVHYDRNGQKVGDRVLAERPLSQFRALLARATRKPTGGMALRQLPTGKDYWFRVRVTPEEYTLTTWPAGRREPSPQVRAPVDRLSPPPGAAGIIAHYCAVNVYEFHFEADSVAQL